MSIKTTSRITLTLLSLAVAGAVHAQQPQQSFPDQQTQPKSCQEFGWSDEMLQAHPRTIDACQEAVYAGGAHWARLAARFVRMDNDQVVFSIRDRRDNVIEEVTLQPEPGQVAYINDRATPFNRLRSSDDISLYVAEGQYGYSTRPGATREQITYVAPRSAPSSAPAPVTSPLYTQQRTDLAAVNPQQRQAPMPDYLPQTAGMLPWLAFGGVISLLAGLGLTLVRRF